jgi:hypothetical protein
MELNKIKIGDKVVFIPHHLLIGDKNAMVQEKNLGIVTSVNDHFAFVRFNNQTGSEACKANDLFTLDNRPDLQELLTPNSI